MVCCAVCYTVLCAVCCAVLFCAVLSGAVLCCVVCCVLCVMVCVMVCVVPLCAELYCAVLYYIRRIYGPREITRTKRVYEIRERIPVHKHNSTEITTEEANHHEITGSENIRQKKLNA